MWIILISLLALFGALYILYLARKDGKESKAREDMYSEMYEHGPDQLDLEATLRAIQLRKKLEQIEREREEKNE
jgi:hypothetical protein